jgi:hypothetical protein
MNLPENFEVRKTSGIRQSDDRVISLRMNNSPLVLAKNGPAKDAIFREAISCGSISFSGYFLPERLLFALL